MSLAAVTPPALALPEDRNQPLSYDAVSGDMLVDDNLMVLEGNVSHPVVITQGTLQVTALHVEGRGIINQELPLHLTGSGEPASFQIQPRADRGLLYGNARTLVYDESSDLLTLEQEARLEIDNHVVRGDIINYELTPSIIRATAPGDGSLVRVEIPTEDGPITGHALSAIYDEGRGLVTLEGDACLQLQDVVFRGYYATFDLNTERASARGQDDTDIIRINERDTPCE